MKLRSGIAAVALALFLLAACEGAPRSSPEGSVRSFLDALAAQDRAEVEASFTAETRSLVAEVESLSRRAEPASGQPAITIQDWCRAFCGGNVEGSTLHGDSAIVVVTVEGDPNEIPLVREEDEWKIDLAERLRPAVQMLRLTVSQAAIDTPGAQVDTMAGAAPDTIP
ncbi:MAG TPA: hypothetical protein VFH11_05660 [Gemmatimonadota bacterium]|nr:hypothetical protein [Gemmatimonadota bacterium]